MIEKSSKMPSQSCACKGIRTCLICEESKRQQQQLSADTLVEYVYCWRCGDKAYLASSFEAHLESHKLETFNDNSDQQLEPSSTVIPIDGVYLQEEALTREEELKLVGSIDSFDWVDSQSGRRKQDFGPKINFKKKKINFAPFAGLPQLDVSLLEQIKSHRLRDDANWSKFEGSMANTALEDDHSKGILRNFKTVEICHLEYCMPSLYLTVIWLAIVSCINTQPLFYRPDRANWIGYGLIWPDFRMLLRESVCTSLVNNETDVILFGMTFDGYVALLGTGLYGYRVGRSRLSSESGRHYRLTLSDRFEIEPVHLMLEWKNITWHQEDDDIVNMYFQHEGKDNPELVIQTTSRRITLEHNSFRVFSENYSPPDGLVFLSTTNRSNPIRTALAIRNLPDRICLIDHKSQLHKVTDQYLGLHWGPKTGENWPSSSCIPSTVPVACGGVLDDDFRMILTFRNRTVSVIDYKSNLRVVQQGYYKDFLVCHDSNRTILLVIAILLIVGIGFLVLVLFVTAAMCINDMLKPRSQTGADVFKKDQPKTKSPQASSTQTQSRNNKTSTTPTVTKEA